MLLQLRLVGFHPLEVAISLMPLPCVAATTVVEVYPGPWQTEHSRERCLLWWPVEGGTPWQLVQASVAVVDHVPVPWHELAQVCAAAFQPTVEITSFTPFRCVAALAAVEL